MKRQDDSGELTLHVDGGGSGTTHVIVDSGHIITDTGSTTAVTGNVTVVQPTGTDLHAVVDSGTVTVSGSVTANAGTNLNTSALALDASVTALNKAYTVTALQVTASGDTTLVSSGTHKIHRVEMSNSHATTALVAGLKVASLNSGAVFSKKYLPAAGGLGVLTFGQGYLQVTSEAISVNLSALGQVEVTIYYE